MLYAINEGKDYVKKLSSKALNMLVKYTEVVIYRSIKH